MAKLININASIDDLIHLKKKISIHCISQDFIWKFKFERDWQNESWIKKQIQKSKKLSIQQFQHVFCLRISQNCQIRIKENNITIESNVKRLFINSYFGDKQVKQTMILYCIDIDFENWCYDIKSDIYSLYS
jgi:hypothetical protein